MAGDFVHGLPPSIRARLLKRVRAVGFHHPLISPAQIERSGFLTAVSPLAIILEILLIAPDISEHSSTKLIEKFSRYNTVIDQASQPAIAA
jgi:hypothetical protein